MRSPSPFPLTPCRRITFGVFSQRIESPRTYRTLYGARMAVEDWGGCLIEPCGSYDKGRDVDLMIVLGDDTGTEVIAKTWDPEFKTFSRQLQALIGMIKEGS